MSTFANPVVVIDNLRPNPNSDTLDIWDGPQGPCQVKRGSFQLHDLAIFVPADSLVDTTRPEFAHLAKLADGPNGRFPGMFLLRGVKLRGQLSVGLLLPLPPQFSSMPVGTDMSEVLGTVKWTPVVTQGHTDYPRARAADEVPLKVRSVPAYDVENAWRFARYAETDTTKRQWVISEKIHGMNFRMCMTTDGKILVGSRTRWLRDECADKPGEWWHEVLKTYDVYLCSMFDYADKHGFTRSSLTFYGEVFGPTQDLKYGSPKLATLRLFDIYDGDLQTFLGWSSFFEIASLGRKVPEMVAPALQQTGLLTLKEAVVRARELAPGLSTLGPNMREGVVVRPELEEVVTLTDTAPDGMVRTKQQRLQFKVISPEYLSRKDGSEGQE